MPTPVFLHYIENSAVCQDGDVLLMDVGAEYGNYASDMTRCLPVSLVGSRTANARFTTPCSVSCGMP